MSKLNVMAMALLLAVLGGCANMSGTLVGTSAAKDAAFPYQPDAIPKMAWTNDD
jgi:hypothetical protein